MEKCPLDIIVAGGSLAGLMQGIALKRAGHNVRIFEQVQLGERQSQAAGIMCGPVLQQFFEEHQIDVSSSHVAPKFIEIRDQQLKLVSKRALPNLCTSWTVLYHVLRAHFDSFFSKACPQVAPLANATDGKASFEVGKRVVNVTLREQGRVIVTYDNLETGERKNEEADLVIAADGANSKLRRLMMSPAARPYSGYVAWRGSLPESEISDETLDLIGTKSNVFKVAQGTYLVVYLTPSDSGNIQPGFRLVNWLRYEVMPQDSKEFINAMTDTSGQFHRNTLPIGKMQPSVWSRQLQRAEAHKMNPLLLELLHKTKQPFITAVTDVKPPSHSERLIRDHRVVIVGEAYSLIRPHIGASTNQAATHALNLAKVLRGEMGLDEFDLRARQFYEYNAAINNMVMARFMGSWWMMFVNVFVFSVALGKSLLYYQ